MRRLARSLSQINWATGAGAKSTHQFFAATIDSLKIVQVSLSVDHFHAGYKLKIS